jgi:hypothetical protein
MDEASLTPNLIQDTFTASQNSRKSKASIANLKFQ